jgi:hypothetical protein
MVGTKLILIIEIPEGKLLRLDLLETIPKETIHMVRQPPLILSFDSPSELPIYIERVKGFREKANALLVGERITIEDNLTKESTDYYPASYCKI